MAFKQLGPESQKQKCKDKDPQTVRKFDIIYIFSHPWPSLWVLYSSGIKIFNFQLICFQASAHNKNLDVGANIFIGNLDPEIDEKLLYDTFSAFGVILQTPKVPSNV